jgi:hypothetical protein
LPLNRWKEDARDNGILDHDLAAHFDFIEDAVAAEESRLRVVLNDPSEVAHRRSIASLLLSASECLTPEDRFVANLFLILNRTVYAIWRAETENIVAELVAEAWSTIAESQRFSLLAPATNAPRILAATRDTSTSGLRKAARILLAAQCAINVRVQDEVSQQLLALARVTDV